MILLCADGLALRQIAGEVGMDQHQVGLWRRRFLDRRLEGLQDQPRPGRPRRLGHDERLKMAAIATSERDPDDPVATWTCFEVAAQMLAEGIQVSVSQVWRILAAMDIDLTKVRGWLNRRDDPTFWERDFEYVRHGTASLFAALDVHSGQVLAEPIPGKNDSVNFCEFLDGIEATVDPREATWGRRASE